MSCILLKNIYYVTQGKIYEKCAALFNRDKEDVLFLTRNSYFSNNIESILGCEIFETDIIYVHFKGETLLVTLIKESEPYGFCFRELDNGLLVISKFSVFLLKI